jgi:hypothetical protein
MLRPPFSLWLGECSCRLGRYLAGCSERVVDLVRILLAVLHRRAAIGRRPSIACRATAFAACVCAAREDRDVHFLDGTPTTIVLDLDRDEPRLLDWFGLPDLGDGESRWFDLAARGVAIEPEPLCR